MVLLSGWEPDHICLQLQDKNISPVMTPLVDGNDRLVWNDISHLPAAAYVLWQQCDRLKLHGE